MIEGVSHITFIVRDLDKTRQLFVELFDAKETYYSGDKKHSLYREVFFLVGNQWIAVMEDNNILKRTYHHIAFKIQVSEAEEYLERINALNLELHPPRQREAGEGISIYFYDYDNNLFELHTDTLEKRLDAYKEIDSIQ